MASLAGGAPCALYVHGDKDVSDPGNENMLLGPSRPFPLSPSSLQMASNCFSDDLSVQAAGTWSERPFHIFISLWTGTGHIKPPFTLSKELFVQRKGWGWWTVSCGHQSPGRFLFFSQAQVGVLRRV